MMGSSYISRLLETFENRKALDAAQKALDTAPKPKHECSAPKRKSLRTHVVKSEEYEMQVPDTGNGEPTGADAPTMPIDTSSASSEIPQDANLEAPQAEETQEDAGLSELLSPNETDAPDAPKVIDGWEFLAADPAYEGNATLLYDNGEYTVFVQKDAEPNETPYLCMTQNAAGQEQQYTAADMNSICAWLESVEMPAPSEDAKAALVGYSHESSEKDKKPQQPPKPLDVCNCDKKLSKEFKLSKDSPEIARTAPKVKEPVVSNVDKEQK